MADAYESRRGLNLVPSDAPHALLVTDNRAGGASRPEPPVHPGGPATDLQSLAARLPAGTLVSDRQVLQGFEQDITGRFSGTATALARPRDTEQVAAIVAACRRASQPLVVQGGNTGLVGAGVPRDGELVLSLRQIDWLGDIDLDSNQLDVGAGTTLEAVQQCAADAGLELPIDHPARASATIGGAVATNAGGALALRHGSMRRRVVGLEAVLADGSTISRMAGLLKDNAGYDLPALFIGSEGTLAAITAARLQLEPAKPFRLVALFGLESLEAGLGLLRCLRRNPALEALDVFDAESMELVRRHRRLRAPLPSPAAVYVIAQLAGEHDATEDLAAALEGLDYEPDVVVAIDRHDRRRLWEYRESISESVGTTGIPHKLDIAVPIAALPAFDRDVRQRLAKAVPEAHLYIYGHLGDGNLHLNVVGTDPEDDYVDEVILRCVAQHAGTISAEHGVGFAKRRYLSLCRSPADIAAMTAVKSALDPTRIMGPGRILPD